MSITEIKEILKKEHVEVSLIEELMKDERKGVKQALNSYFKRIDNENKERLRVEEMYTIESEFYKKGIKYIAGIDEVGRGPLAGPVTVAAVILKPHWYVKGLNDSKKISYEKREIIAKKIHEEALAVSIVSLEPKEIDTLNIYQATMLAMYKAVKELSIEPQAVIVDAMPLHFSFPCKSLIHGDSKSASVAAASIIAKVHRDHIMEKYSKIYPGYDFEGNKGYGTKTHINAIYELGVTPIHRKSYEPVKSIVLGRNYKKNCGKHKAD